MKEIILKIGDSEESKKTLEFVLSTLGIFDVPSIKIQRGEETTPYLIDEHGRVYKGRGEIEARIKLYFQK